ncbi:phosphodiester glycosidase family protein [Streptomyces sp. NBC_00102]|uniref:phosphodiester glycosidase family protein n=1 Tax=Streptomyces sp. NBC_00102 TaxID=2975652 RepID=UPI002250CE2F|nr:phosphodiester glycosidase family protein [Streptomyces sp. NBC_00102]MCX5401439.1 phosphodiester glycosidase family protein [Streptomyces sp. NBC_00102]
MRRRPGPAVRSARAFVLFATVCGTVVGVITPAAADTTPDPHPRSAAEILRPVAPPGPSTPAGTGDSADPVIDDHGIETARTSRPVAPGVGLTSYDRLEADKWLRVDALTVDLSEDVRADYLSTGKVGERRTVSELAAGHDAGAGRRTVAAVNADFFDINETGAPQGPGVRDGLLDHSPAAGSSHAVGIDADNAGRILDLYFEGTLTLPSGDHPLGGYDAANVPAGSVGAYTSAWGGADRALTVDAARPVAEALVRDGRVVSVSATPGSGPVPEGATVLVGREAGAALLTALRPGDPVGMTYRARTGDDGPLPRTAVGGRELLVVDGVEQNHDGEGNNTAAPRTAVGFSRDGRTMHVVTVDGRQADSGGVTLTELGRMMREAGAWSALNLDGGGSSTLVAREPGTDTVRVENSPSDGSERTVPNGLALTVPDGSGALTGYWVQTRTPPAAAPGDDPVAGGHPDRVFPGLTRALTAAGYDETYGPAAGAPHWRTTAPGVGTTDARGLFTARHGGTTEAVAERGRARGSVRLTVLDELVRVSPTIERLGLSGQGATGTFGIVGSDAHGDSAPVEPRDLTLDYDHTLFDVRDDGRGSFTVSARAGQGAAGLITASVHGTTTVLAVTVGLGDQAVAGFDDADAWKFSQARASGSLAATEDGHTGTGLKLDYDFTQSTATRAAYAAPPQPVAVGGRPQSFTLWINGDGKGAWPTLHLKDAAGSDQLLRGPYITWTGWRQVTFTVPAGAPTPLSVYRFYLAETAAGAQYTGGIVIDDLVAQVVPAAELPAREQVTDPLIDPAAVTEGRDARFAVMSDAQFVARDPDSAIVDRARHTLREIKAAHPDFLVIDGDLVDEGSPADLDFARQVLTEELGDDLPWTYVPGNHEVMGGSIGAFTDRFGPAHRTFDHGSTRFITLDTSSLSLRGGGYAQIREFREQLDAAATDPDIGSVVLIEHVPPRDPTVQRASQLGDRKEAALVEEWLAGFRRTTGKGAAFIGGHVGVFDASHVDGVPYLVNGNSGKTPSGPADEGGFTGWSLVGTDRVTPAQQAAARQRPWAGGPDWISVQTRAYVDDLTLDAPATLPAGGSVEVSARITQGTRAVPVAFPVSADWSGSPNLRIGSTGGRRASGRPVAVLDPATGTLTALRPGTVTLAVTVNGVTRNARVTIAAEGAGRPAA